MKIFAAKAAAKECGAMLWYIQKTGSREHLRQLGKREREHLEEDDSRICSRIDP